MRPSNSELCRPADSLRVGAPASRAQSNEDIAAAVRGANRIMRDSELALMAQSTVGVLFLSGLVAGAPPRALALQRRALRV